MAAVGCDVDHSATSLSGCTKLPWRRARIKTVRRGPHRRRGLRHHGLQRQRRLLLVPLRAPQHRGHARNGSRGYIVGTYDKDAGRNNQRVYLNGTRLGQKSDKLPVDLNSAPLAASDGM
jgi:hypothetical protein